jgi:hypothetical protein
LALPVADPDGHVGYVYANALRGFSITMPRAALAGVARNPRVAYVEEDIPVGIVAQALPTGVDRIFQPWEIDPPETTGSMIDDKLSIDGIDDWRVDVDVAVLDTGIDQDHPDPSSTNQGSTWTAIVDAVNCIGEDVASFGTVSLSWSPQVGTVTDDCSTSTGVCQATQSGIRKKTGSVQFTLNGSTTMVSKP